MNIDMIKGQLENNINQEIIIIYNLGRNKIERFAAKIKEIYDYIFIVEVKETLELKSFMYSDVITNTIKIEYQQKKIAF